MRRRDIEKGFESPTDLRQRATTIVTGSPVLTRALVASEVNLELVEQLCWAAGALRNHEQIDVLLHIIESGQPDERAAMHAAGALQHLCSRRTTRRLLAVVGDRRRPVELRKAAIYALVFLFDRRAIECIGWASREPELCRVGVLALGFGQLANGKAARRHLEWHSSHGDVTTRERAAHYLTCMTAQTESGSSDIRVIAQSGKLESRGNRQERIVSMVFYRKPADTLHARND